MDTFGRWPWHMDERSWAALNLCFPGVSGARRTEFMDVVNVLDKLLIVMAAARLRWLLLVKLSWFTAGCTIYVYSI